MRSGHRSMYPTSAPGWTAKHSSALCAKASRWDGDKLTAGQPIYVTLTGGEDETVAFVVNVNTTRPVFSLSAVRSVTGSPAYARNTWTKDNVKLTITATHPEMVATYYYSIDEGATWKKITLKADGTYTFNVSCDPDTELERVYKFKSVAASGSTYGETSYQIKIDKVGLTSVVLSGAIEGGKPAYSSAVTLTANKAATYSYTFTAPGGEPVVKSAGGMVIGRQLGDSGSYTNITATDKVGNTLSVPDFIIAKKPDLAVEASGDTATFTVTNTTPDDLTLEYYSDENRAWTPLDGNTFVAEQTKEYRFRATNNLSGALSSVIRITLTV